MMKDDDAPDSLVGLAEMVKVIAPQGLDLVKNHHQALADAQMCRLLYLGYLELARKAGCVIQEEE